MSNPSPRVLAVLAAGAVAVPVAVAEAKPVKVTGQQTVVTLTGPATQVLTAHGVSVTAVAPATVSGATVTFPVKGGRLNAKVTRGIVRHAGGLTFTRGGRSLTIRRPVAVVTRRRAFLAVHTHGRLVRVFHLTGLSKTTSGTTTTVTADLRVTARLAKRLNRRLGTTVRRGAKAGTVTTTLTS